MMKRVFVLGLGMALATQASAQAPVQCAGGTTQDACQQAIDVFKLMAPQLGIAITGGNATLG